MERAPDTSGTNGSFTTPGRPLRPGDLSTATPLLERLPHPAVWIDPSHRIVWRNPAAAEAYGGGGEPCYRALHGYDAPCQERGEPCPLEGQGVGSLSTSTFRHVHRSSHGPELHLVSSLPLEGGGVLEMHVPLGDDLVRDSLTGLYSRTVFEQLARMQLQLLRRLREGYSVVLADLDRLKAINDRYGHPIGDLAIRVVASTVAANVRTADCVGRWGGDEICILLPSATRSDATRLVRRISCALEGARIEGAPGVEPRVSFGLASCRRTYDLLRAIKRADRSLYRVKAARADVAAGPKSLRA